MPSTRHVVVKKLDCPSKKVLSTLGNVITKLSTYSYILCMFVLMCGTYYVCILFNFNIKYIIHMYSNK